MLPTAANMYVHKLAKGFVVVSLALQVYDGQPYVSQNWQNHSDLAPARTSSQYCVSKMESHLM